MYMHFVSIHFVTSAYLKCLERFERSVNGLESLTCNILYQQNRTWSTTHEKIGHRSTFSSPGAQQLVSAMTNLLFSLSSSVLAQCPPLSTRSARSFPPRFLLSLNRIPSCLFLGAFPRTQTLNCQTITSKTLSSVHLPLQPQLHMNLLGKQHSQYLVISTLPRMLNKNKNNESLLLNIGALSPIGKRKTCHLSPPPNAGPKGPFRGAAPYRCQDECSQHLDVFSEPTQGPHRLLESRRFP